MFHLSRSSVVVLAILFLPSTVLAQAALTGVVRDTSGAVLPGVTVEAASPALIEKVRSVVSDDSGQYRIVALPPGSYTVTFSLPGFSTVKRDGIELTGEFVATVNGDLQVGALEETITVTGETPIVDVQSARTQTTVSKDVLAAIPSSRTASGIQALIPGMSTSSDAGGAAGATGGAAGNIHGGRADDSSMQNDGLSTTWQGGSGGGGNNANVAGAQEIVVSTSGGLGEAEKGGVIINLIPREGGNTFTGTFFYSGANGAMQGSNYTQELRDRGLRSPQEIISVYDLNPMGGGRIIRDKLWFYNTLRVWGAHNTVPGMFWNRNAGDVTKWTYDPDFNRPASADNQNGTAITRLTWQATPRNKVAVYWSEQWNLGNEEFKGGTATTAPEAHGKLWYRPSRVQQATWSSPLTSRVLLEAGFGTYEARYRQNGAPREDGTHNPALIQVVEQAGIIPGLTYRFKSDFHHRTIGTHTWRASVAYVTGAHSMKFGYYGGLLNPMQHTWYARDDGITSFRFRDGVPNRITLQAANPLVPGENRFVNHFRNGWPTAFYAQDQWTMERLTLQGGVRYDHYMTNYPEHFLRDSPLVPEPIVFPSRSTPGLNWDDITPRMGAAYDLFGNGKTAIKVNLGKYPNAVIVQDGDFDLNPLARITLSTTRSWTDTDKDFVPDCNLANTAKNAECGPLADQNLGRNRFSRTYDPTLTEGWSTRPYQWEMGASVQHELVPRVSLNVGYYRRWFGNFYTTDNRLVGPSDFDPFQLTVAADPRLPNAAAYTITGLYDLNPTKFGQVDDYRTRSSYYGEQSENWHGVDVTFNARLRNGLTVQGGTSTGRRLTDNCEIREKLPELGPVNPYCRVVEPYQTQVRGLASYTIPRVGVQVSGTFQSNPGPQQLANYDVPTALIRPSLGRDLSGGANATIDLVGPGALYGDRVNQLDFRFAKIFRFGRTRTQIGVDLYNATNTAVPLTYNNGYVPGGSWLVPNSILVARYAKVSAQFDF
jgi:hypothetical protein